LIGSANNRFVSAVSEHQVNTVLKSQKDALKTLHNQRTMKHYFSL